MKLPEKGLSPEEILRRLETYRSDDMPWREGRTWAYIYDPGREAEEVIHRAYTMYLTENALDPTVFPSTLRLENEVIGIAAEHLGGDDQVVGNFTSGGTESILLAVKAARDYARKTRPGIERPEMVLPVTAHAAFQKAGHYLGVEPVLVPVDPVSFRADVEAIRRAITPRTILLVGSAVSYAHGVVDPIPEIAALARERAIWLHVDACMGGFLLPYFRRLGAEFPDFDFRVDGVTSISMDFHKYAFAAKGASSVLYRSREYRKCQMYACANWPGYTVINATVQSTKSAGPVAAAWAVLHFFGDEGYLEIARRVKEATEKVVRGIEAIPGLRVLGRPDMNLVAFTSDEASVFHIVDEMRARSWYVQPQLAYPGSKENIHLSINPTSVRWVEDFLRDLRDAVESAKKLPPGKLAALVREHLPAGGSFDENTFDALAAAAGIEGEKLPSRMAEINEVLNALSPAQREELLVEFLDRLYRPVR
ncbi:MAG: aspartate aminotransferase family protein [Candidatus Binatia bacterium]|nr:MAG: aspartate aminotransferase family protein [Candidatus Binatia bacterium]